MGYAFVDNIVLEMYGRSRILSCLVSGKCKAFYFLFPVELPIIILEQFCFLSFHLNTFLVTLFITFICNCWSLVPISYSLLSFFFFWYDYSITSCIKGQDNHLYDRLNSFLPSSRTIYLFSQYQFISHYGDYSHERIHISWLIFYQNRQTDTYTHTHTYTPLAPCLHPIIVSFPIHCYSKVYFISSFYISPQLTTLNSLLLPFEEISKGESWRHFLGLSCQQIQWSHFCLYLNQHQVQILQS